MKQLFAILLLAICTAVSYKAEAQDYHRNITGIDSFKNAMADTTIVTITGSKSAITWFTIVDSLSGTVAGTIYLEGTIDTAGTPDWKLIDSDTLVNQAVNIIEFKQTANHYKKYRLRRDTEGTVTCLYTTFLLYRE